MNLANRPWKLYLRLVVVAVVLLAALLVLFMNRTNYVRVWFFGLTSGQPVNVVWLMLSTALGTMTGWRVFAFSRGLLRDLRDSAKSGSPATRNDTGLTVHGTRPAEADAETGMERESTAGVAVKAKEMRQ